MSAKLSSTLAGMAIFEFHFLFLLLRPRFGQRLVAGLAPDDSAPMLDQRGGHGLEENSVWCGLNDGFGAVLDIKPLSQPGGDYYLSFGCEPDGIGLFCCTHRGKSDVKGRLRQHVNCKNPLPNSDCGIFN